MAGKKVIMLEAGPERSMESLISSQIWARKLKWGGSPVEESGNHKIGFNFNSGWGTGGTGMHHYGVWPRLHENDFNQRQLFGKGNDWPINYADLQPYYDQIQAEIGLSGDEKLEQWRPKGAPYPMPPVPVFAQGRVIARGFKAMAKHTAPIPLAINTLPRDGRSSCIYDGWCDAGCPTGALANPLSHYLPQAIKAGAEIIHRASVTKILTNQKGDRVTGVEYYLDSKQKHTILASAVILAGGAVQNPRLLLASANAAHPLGLSNSNDMVGRYLMTHPSKTVNGLFKDKTEPHFGVTGGQLINQDSYDDKLAIKDAFGGYQWLIANAVKPNDLLGFANSRPDRRGKALTDFMKKAAKHFGTMVYVADDLPLAENRVSLSNNTDQFGMPIAHATHSIQAPTSALIAHADAEGLEIFKQAGAEQAWLGPLAGMHIMGGTIMGKSSHDSVTNRYGQSHEIANLFIAGAGIFPSSGAVNPTFTLHAIALSGVEYMLKEWSGLS
jgi:choline dehydrogenase-like flavoprotein